MSNGMPRHDRITPIVAYALSGLGVVLTALALVVFKPRVPDRSSGQSVDEYWSTPDVVAKVLPVWFLMEGAGTIAGAGYFFTGESVSAIATGATIVAFWLCGPNLFAKGLKYRSVIVVQSAVPAPDHG